MLRRHTRYQVPFLTPTSPPSPCSLGTTITWIVVFSVVNGVIFVAPPYGFSISETGLISLSPFIMTIFGEMVSGPLNDWICVYLTRKNKGIYEPEFRLPLMVVTVVTGTVGFFGFGATIHYQTHWSGPVLTFGLANLSLVFAAICVYGYIGDAYRKLNEEALVAINARNLLTFGLTYFVNDWLAEQGPLVVFCILGSLFLFVCSLTIPLWYVYICPLLSLSPRLLSLLFRERQTYRVHI